MDELNVIMFKDFLCYFYNNFKKDKRNSVSRLDSGNHD